MLAHILVVIIVAIVITGLAERRNAQPALLVAIIGLAASFIPGVPRLELAPEIILGVFLPPMLFSAASDFSFASFAKRLGSIVNLGVFLVFASAALVGLVAALIVPGMGLASAIVLGAVLAPPDAVAAIAIGRQVGLPAAVMTVLKGESLINDAAALTLFTVAVAAVSGTHAFISSTPLYFLYAAVVGIIVGIVIGQLAQLARRRLSNPSLATAVSVLVPFAAYLAAEEIHASGVLAVVAAGFALGHLSAKSGYAERIQERNFWRTIDTLLETFVFAYIGLQLRFVITDASLAGYDMGKLLLAAGAIYVAATLVRFAWVFGTAVLGRWRHRLVMDRLAARPDVPKGPRGSRPLPPPPLGWKENLVIAWTGMRGVVTLAAAAGIPAVTAAGTAFPGRNAILAIAFFVTIASLVVHGLSLPWLIRTLKLEDERERQFMRHQSELAQQLSDEADRQTLDAYLATELDPEVRRLTEFMAKRLAARRQQTEQEFDTTMSIALGAKLLEGRRARLLAARDARELDDTVVRDMLERMDIEQAFMQTLSSASR
ncbi:cation:proton antiporter [Devosia aquimaris]|uniref:cation:proton antiporter n=1 Tax=Devosia aquimaris TaxID=2866214 RepID=UPI001CD10B8D|nr:sodium:proton antiporter [Devosia sp. CJK-A8-3]